MKERRRKSGEERRRDERAERKKHRKERREKGGERHVQHTHELIVIDRALKEHIAHLRGNTV
jgi:hypothetical protein